jgi:uncharacterized protein DUF6166
MSKRYYGVPVPSPAGEGLIVRVADSDLPDAKTRPLPPRFDLQKIAPLSWGAKVVGTREQPNPGAAQLALAILADCLGDDLRARGLYRRFAHRLTTDYKQHEAWSLSGDRVLQIVAEMESVEQDPQLREARRKAAQEGKGRGPVVDERERGNPAQGVGPVERSDDDSGDDRFTKR